MNLTFGEAAQPGRVALNDDSPSSILCRVEKGLWQTALRVVVALLLVCAFGPRPARADEVKGAAPLFLKAADQADIRSPGSPPFELDAKLNFFGDDGKRHPGSYKLVWLSPSEWREEISFNGYSRIRVGGEGRYWQQRSSDFELVQIRELTDSLDFVSRLRAAKSPGKLKSRKESGEVLDCSQTSNPVPIEFCFNPTQGELVLEKIPNGPRRPITEPVSIRYSNFQAFGQRRFPGKVQITLGGGPFADFSVERLAGVEKTNPSDFDPLAGASLWLTCVAPEKQRMLRQVPPTYPMEEMHNHRQGIVLMYGIIAPDGSVHSLKVLRAPSQAFADASVAAVRQWRYEPLICGGVPTQLETFIHVIFSLSN